MKKVNGIWMPDGEVHMLSFLNDKSAMIDGRGTYQYKKLVKALSLCKNFRTAIDVGSHVGTWSMHLAKKFNTVECFEPMAEHRACWVKNLSEVGLINKCNLYRYGLGMVEGKFWISTNPESTGDTWIEPEGYVPTDRRNRFEIEVERLDTFEFTDVDLIKIDCEGFELPVLYGAEATIAKWKPLIVVEQKPGRGEKFGYDRTAACTFLETLGAKRLSEISGDYFYGW